MIDLIELNLKKLNSNTEFKRIENNERISSVKLPYTLKYLNYLRELFEIDDEFEKCIIIVNYIDKYFKFDSNSQLND